MTQAFRSHTGTGNWAHHYDDPLPDAVTEEVLEENNSNFNIL